MVSWTINLTNNISFQSNNYSWKKLPNNFITSIELHLPNEKTIILEGFEAYLIITTNYQILKGGVGTILDTVNILGKYKKSIYQLSYHRKNKIFQCNNPYPLWKPLVLHPKTKKSFEIEYSKALSTNPTDWHEGVWTPETKVYIK